MRCVHCTSAQERIRPKSEVQCPTSAPRFLTLDFRLWTLDFLSSLLRMDKRRGERVEDTAPVRGAEQVFAGAFRMRHQPHDVARAVADASDVVTRAVRVGFVCDVAHFIAVTK